LKEALQSYAASLGLQDRVRFMGYRDDIPDFYAMADVFVFPSFREGLSVSVMEAMASGKPVVCSKIRGNTDMVEDGENGFLIDPASPESIAGALEKVLEPETLARQSRVNREKAERFDLSAVVPRYRELYLEETGE